jgi:predicted metal-dependent hydrolase
MELENIPHKVSYRKIKYPRLEFTTGELHLILPLNARHEELFKKHNKWIQKKMEFIEECLKESPKKELMQREEDDFKGLVLTLIMQAADELNVKLNNVYFRSMKTKWASFSAQKNLMINKLAKYLPEYLIKYIIFHELAHLKQKRHNEKFWQIISGKFGNYQNLEKELFVYWFRLSPTSA